MVTSMALDMTETQYEAYVTKHATWNFAVNVLDLTFFHFASSFIFGATVLSLYASHLTSSAALIGLIPAIQQVGYYLPQLFLAHHIETLPRKKPLLIRISVFERLPYLFVALMALLVPGAPHWLSYVVLALSLAMAATAGGLIGPAWQNMLAKVIEPERRGFFFGLSNALGGLLGVAGAAISRYVLGAYAYPTTFGLCFLLAFGAQVLSWLSVASTREPARDPQKESLPVKEYLARLPAVLRSNPNFMRYLASRALIILGTMATAFYIVYARKEFGVDDAFAGTLTMVALVSQTLFTPLLGWLADHKGHKWATEVCTALGIGAAILALVGPSTKWLYGVFVLMNASTSGMMVASLSMVMTFAKPDDLPTYIGLTNTLLAVPILVAPVLGGWIVDLAGFRVLFWVALAMGALGLVTMRWAVREPEHAESPLTSGPQEQGALAG